MRAPSGREETGKELGRSIEKEEDGHESVEKSVLGEGKQAGFGWAKEGGIDEEGEGIAKPKEADQQGFSRVQRGRVGGSVGVDG
jgi:hypothetical protein